MDRRLEYDTGPDLEDDDEPSAVDEGDRGDRLDAPWKVGLAAGAGTFVTVYAIMYQLASAMLAWGALGPPEAEPSRRVLAGLLLFGGHGARIEENGEPIMMTLGIDGGFLVHLSALVPVVVLVAAGYLLVRYLAADDFEATTSTAARGGGAFVAGYLVLSVLLAAITNWTRGQGPAGVGGGEAEPVTVAVATDSSLVITVAGTVAAFLAIGGLLALIVTYELADARGGGSANDGGSDPDAGNGDRGGDPTPDEGEPATDRSSTSGYGDSPPARRSVDPERPNGDATRSYGSTDDRGDRDGRR